MILVINGQAATLTGAKTAMLCTMLPNYVAICLLNGREFATMIEIVISLMINELLEHVMNVEGSNVLKK